MDITTVYQKERKEFGRPCNTFSSTEGEVLDEFVPDKDFRNDLIERNPTVLDIQAVPTLSESYVSLCFTPDGIPFHAPLHPMSPLEACLG